MTVDLHCVFRCIAVRSFHDQDQDFIDHLVLITDISVLDGMGSAQIDLFSIFFLNFWVLFYNFCFLISLFFFL